MAVMTKRRKEFANVADDGKVYSLDEAFAQIEKFPATKFDETVELHIALNVDPKASDQGVRGTVVLPHGTGRKIRVAAICKGDAAKAAEDNGADYVGAVELIEKIANGFMDFDTVIATPDMMRDLSKLGKILGPRGLMPSPKAGTVTTDVAKVLKDIKAGRVEFKSDKQGDIHLGIGKRSFAKQQLLDNCRTVLDAIEHGKPSAVKGNLIKQGFISTTMGPGLKVAV